jgi:transcription factor SFP1
MARASTTLSRPASSLLLSKPFKCPKPNCNKSYKQANGLKYHMTHGSCNFAPPKDLEHLQALLASRQSQKSDDGEPLSESELREVEKEAERRLRPYACGVGDCQRRYKNMNGLRECSSETFDAHFALLLCFELLY